ncbi:MAG: O-acetyl-ADP-ribose deacetylase [Planctomycetia bacterium]|nr:O-acetyl-ADP-ribose deacetylase [Planctomycetia bacterium]
MQIMVVRGDITQMDVDVIVNAANCSLLGGGGVDGAIHRAAGKELLEECRTLGGCETGEAKITRGYRLPASWVIHTPGPRWRGGTHNESRLLENSYRNSLFLAEEKECQTIAFPSISTGVYRFPLELAAPIAIQTIRRFSASFLQTAWMVCFDEETFQAYSSVLENFPEL